MQDEEVKKLAEVLMTMNDADYRVFKSVEDPSWYVIHSDGFAIEGTCESLRDQVIAKADAKLSDIALAIEYARDDLNELISKRDRIEALR